MKTWKSNVLIFLAMSATLRFPSCMLTNSIGSNVHQTLRSIAHKHKTKLDSSSVCIKSWVSPTVKMANTLCFFLTNILGCTYFHGVAKCLCRVMYGGAAGC